MTGDDPFAIVPSAPARERELGTVVREVVRKLLAADPASLPAVVAALGRQAIAAAVDASARLVRHVGGDNQAVQVLADLQALATALDAPRHPPAKAARLGWLTARPAPRDAGPEIRLDSLVPRLEAERDRLALALIELNRTRDAIVRADRVMEEAVHMVRALRAGTAAAAREIRRDEPGRAHCLDTDVANVLIERERDLVTQIVVTRQGLLTLDMLIAGRSALADAVDRARSVTVSALRTATAASNAVALADAAAQVRAALAAVDPLAHG